MSFPELEPIGDAYGAAMREEGAEREERLWRLATHYPIVQIARLAPRIDDRGALATIAWVVQRRHSARETFEALIDAVDDDVLASALDRLWAVSGRGILAVYARVLGVRHFHVISASQVALSLLERGAQPLAMTRVLTRTFDDDDVLRALHENGFGYERAVLNLVFTWSRARVHAALSRTDLLPFAVRRVMASLR